VILIPVKNLSQAKQRLAAVLDQRSRTELARACTMLPLELPGGASVRPALS
jgi:2-phospho-L-lactate guanylyltransferase (CobY/MobA/RfbA family)